MGDGSSVASSVAQEQATQPEEGQSWLAADHVPQQSRRFVAGYFGE